MRPNVQECVLRPKAWENGASWVIGAPAPILKVRAGALTTQAGSNYLED